MLATLPSPDSFGNYWLATSRKKDAKCNCAVIFPHKRKCSDGSIGGNGWWASFGNEETFGKPNGPIFCGNNLRIFDDPQQALNWMLEYVEDARQSESCRSSMRY